MKARTTYWQEKDGKFLGFLNDYPDHWTQGETLDDLREHLRDLHRPFAAETLPGIRRQEELEVASAWLLKATVDEAPRSRKEAQVPGLRTPPAWGQT